MGSIYYKLWNPPISILYSIKVYVELLVMRYYLLYYSYIFDI